VANRDAAIEGSQSAAKCCGSVALHQHQVGALICKDRIQCRHDTRSHLGECLAWPHDAQVVIRGDRKHVERLIEQTSMLRRDYDAVFKFVGDFLKPAHDGRQFDRLRARAQDDQDFQLEGLCKG
jgi:hypothetical protein